MYQEIAAALESLKILRDLWSAHEELSDYNEVSAKISQIYQALIDAQESAIANQGRVSLLQERITQLEYELRQYKNAERNLEQYEPHVFPTGTRALVDKRTMDSDQPPVYACEHCADNGKVSKLQPCGQHHGHNFFLRCNTCGQLFPTHPMSPALERTLRARLKS